MGEKIVREMKIKGTLIVGVRKRGLKFLGQNEKKGFRKFYTQNIFEARWVEEKELV